VFACTNDTKITKNGQEAGFDALAIGDEREDVLYFSCEHKPRGPNH